MQRLVEIGQKGFLEKIFKFRRCILLWYPLGKAMALHLNKLLFPIYKDSFCQVWLKLAQWLWFFFHFINVFSLFRYHPFWKRVWSFIETDLNPFYMYLRMICAKFGWHWTSGYEEEVENVKSLQTDGLIRYKHPWIKGLLVSSNKRSRLSSFGDDNEIAKKYFINVTNSLPSDALRK